MKNADVCVNCDPEKDCREKSLKSDWTNFKLFNLISHDKEEADSEALPMPNTLSVIKEKAGSEQTITSPP